MTNIAGSGSATLVSRLPMLQAYLPDTSEGERALHGLYQAWTQRVLFTVGRSQTTGRVSFTEDERFFVCLIRCLGSASLWFLCGSGSSILGSMRIWVRFRRRGLDDQKLKKFTAEKLFFFKQKLQFTYAYP
jgi:hypothetical protein